MAGILRLLIIAGIIWLLYTWVRKALTAQQQPPTQELNPTTQVMKQCAYCKIHIPEGESTQSQGHFFCSEQHRNLFLQQK